jgi:Recombination endonuclease VII
VKPPVCKDCIAEGVTNWRPPAPDSGPRTQRCVTHRRAAKKRARTLAHGRRIMHGYGLTPEQYNLLYQYQGGRCFVCKVATGKTRALAVEHEHNMEGCTHPPEHGCLRCIRALCCKRCNRLVAFLDTGALYRAILLINDPPARKLFGT